MAAVTRQIVCNKFKSFVGKGKDFDNSEVPTLRSCLQKGILIREQNVIEKGINAHSLSVNETVKVLVPLIFAQWQRANAKFCPPITCKVNLF